MGLAGQTNANRRQETSLLRGGGGGGGRGTLVASIIVRLTVCIP